MSFFACLLFVLSFFPLIGFCDVESHLRKVENKTGPHNMRNIDFIYMINLDQRPEKWEVTNQKLNPYGIFPCRFSAVNGWELSLEEINDVGVKFGPGMIGGFRGTSYGIAEGFTLFDSIIQNEGQVYFCHRLARGTIGIVLSHLSILRDALESQYETIWVMEDDVEVLSDPRQISDLVEKLDRLVGKEGWDVLFTDRNTHDKNGNEVPARGMAKRPNFSPQDTSQYYIEEAVDADFIRIGARFGAYSMILRRSGIEKIYKFITSHSVFLPYDLDFYLPPDIKIYTVSKDVVSNTLQALSDNGAPRYLNNGLEKDK